MAAGRQIVSTPIADVAGPYGDLVYVGAGADGFVAACERALAASPLERRGRRARMQAILGRTSWDDTAEAMIRIARGDGHAAHRAEGTS
jgi:hypothetical protein